MFVSTNIKITSPNINSLYFYQVYVSQSLYLFIELLFKKALLRTHGVIVPWEKIISVKKVFECDKY